MRRLLLAGLALMAAAFVPAERAAAHPWDGSYFPNLPVQDQDGKTLHFYDDLIKGKIVVVSFIYTSCADLCPITTARLAEVKDKLGDRVGRDIFFISLTVDPEHDTPEKLKAFAEAFNTGPGWTFVTAKPADMKVILGKFGDKSEERGLQEHRNEFMIGNDPIGDWQRGSAMGEIDRVVLDILGMDPKWAAQVHEPQYVKAGDTGFKFEAKPGEGMFRKLCAPCHTIGEGVRVGPDLKGVTERRDEAWLGEFMRDPLKMMQKKDPIALALAAQFPAVHMPRLGLTQTDVQDMLAYFKAETARLDAAPPKKAAAAEDHTAHRDN
jgi:cytochrome oxidase Cu insertion factor (SCO1/SenC/PrrC family)/mono/diheme cytochrome c family protein